MAKTLIVDDYPLMRSLLRVRLGEMGCDIHSEASTVAEAKEALEQNKFDLVTLDVLMPTKGEVDTFELFCSIRRQSPKTRIVVLSGLNHSRYVDAYLRYGAVDYFLKPVDFYALSARLREHLPHLKLIQQPKSKSSSRATLPEYVLDLPTVPWRSSLA
ncbi:MAG TPA: response regulator [Candidatus Binataceae bacterium]|nr:response regulator [Candidatus Binataceae bacterium]